MKHQRALLLAIAFALAAGSMAFTSRSASGPDPCSYAVRRQAPLAVSTAGAATLLISNLAGKETHICNIQCTMGGSSSVKLMQGPDATHLTQMNGVQTAFINPMLGTNTLMRTAVGNDLYYTVTGTGCPGFVDYVYENPGNALLNPTATVFATTSPTPTATPTASPTPSPTPSPT